MEARNRARGAVLAGVSAAVAVLLRVGVPAADVPGPQAELRGVVERTLEILKRPDLGAKSRAGERGALLRRTIRPIFDFEEMSKRSLGPEWRNRTPGEREAFVALFAELLENAYLGKIESYRGETIRYGKETIRAPYAVVGTLIVTTRGQEIPVDYRMLEEDGRWRIYDVVIEGVSLVNNYRSQFKSILMRSTFPEMMDRLRDTIRKQES
ncbi:MAG: ABC transporter substrate-binding protein [Gemmatimonadota bacterium]